ncbi:conserved domain protein, partial [Listeria seeligeri FSL S4-171]
MYDLFAKTSHLASRFLFIIRQIGTIWWLDYFYFLRLTA